LFLVAYWAKEKWFMGIMDEDVSFEQKVNNLNDAIQERTPEGIHINMLIFDGVVHCAFHGGNRVGFDPDDVLGKLFPAVKKLEARVVQECPDEVITGTPFVEDDFSLASHVRAIMRDLIDKHISDINHLLEVHYQGSFLNALNTTFCIEVTERVLRCELENLIISGSTFNCNGVRIKMLPMFF